MAVAAFVVAIISVLVTAAGILYARQSVQTARGSEFAAKESADAAKKQAEIWQAHLEIEQRRAHQEMTPILTGVVKKHPVLSRPGLITYQLELHSKTSQPLTSIILYLPDDSWVSVRRGSNGIEHELRYPDLNKPFTKVEPSYPATWPVEITGSRRDAMRAIASCCGENGERWDGIEVLITME
jgi:hypothetical protein